MFSGGTQMLTSRKLQLKKMKRNAGKLDDVSMGKVLGGMVI